MELRAYLDSLKPTGLGAIADFARKCGISETYLYQLAARQDGRQPSANLCVVIERESGAKVTRADLRPCDYADIWPDLVPLPSPHEPCHEARPEAFNERRHVERRIFDVGPPPSSLGLGDAGVDRRRKDRRDGPSRDN